MDNNKMRRNPVDNRVVATVSSPNKETAANATYNEGFCPHCQNQMLPTTCDGIPSWVCLPDRTVLPVKE